MSREYVNVDKPLIFEKSQQLFVGERQNEALKEILSEIRGLSRWERNTQPSFGECRLSRSTWLLRQDNDLKHKDLSKASRSGEKTLAHYESAMHPDLQWNIWTHLYQSKRSENELHTTHAFELIWFKMLSCYVLFQKWWFIYFTSLGNNIFKSRGWLGPDCTGVSFTHHQAIKEHRHPEWQHLLCTTGAW